MNKGKIRVTVAYDIDIDLTDEEERDAWEGAETLREAADNLEKWMENDDYDIMSDLAFTPFESVSVDVW